MGEIMISLNTLRATLIFKLKNVEFGKNHNIIGKPPIITNNGKFKIGNDFQIRSLQFKTEINCLKGAELDIGNNVFINQGANICANKSIIVGNNVHIADLVMIHDTNFHEVEEGEGVTTKAIKIEDNVWIGARSIILPGVKIGKNSVVAAGSVVTKNVPKNSLVAGVPAKVLKNLKCANNYIRT